jgi:hypothetical protein
VPISAPRRVDRRRADQPRQRAAPAQRARRPLDEAGDVEHDDALTQPERDARHGQQAESEQQRALDADTHRHQHRGNRRDKGARRICARQHARRRLGETEVVRVARQQRRDRAEEQRVEEHHRPGEDEQPPHR